jgi:hypothetical protein
MKNNSLFLLVFSLLWPGALLFGQSASAPGNPLIRQSLEYRIDFAVGTQGGRARIEAEPVARLNRATIDSINGQLRQSLELLPLELAAADLKLPVKVLKTGPSQRRIGYRVTATLRAEPSRLGYAFTQRAELLPATELDTLVWADALEQVLEFGPGYSITVAVDIFERIPAKAKPGIGEHLVIAGVGVGLVILGQDFHNKAERDYVRYQSLWQDGGSRQSADPVLASAETQEQNAVRLRWAGIGLIAVDAAWYGIRWIRYRKATKENESAPSLSFTSPTSLRPVYDPVQGMVGMRFTHIF